MKKLWLLGFGFLFLLQAGLAESIYIDLDRDEDRYESNSRYEHIYMNPPQKRLHARGRYIFASSGVTYVHSKTPTVRKAHADRINAYNYQMGNY